MNNQELYSVMVQINWTLKTRALTNMQIEWRLKSAGKWHPFQWEAILHCPTAEGHRVVPSSVSRNGDCLHVWLMGRADLIRLFQKTLFWQTDPVTGDTVRFLYTLLSTPPCQRRYALNEPASRGGGVRRGRDSGERGTEGKGGEGEKEEKPPGEGEEKDKTP